ncbi:Ribosomal protein S18 domain containing protein [Aphelenchoides bicaudatus]|nr:Ribosomal protein S18 domain containing protein [Aphelenchoides bicaudatus]
MVTRLAAGLRSLHTRSRIAIVEEANNVTRVSKQPVEEESKNLVFNKTSNGCSLCTCDIPVKISYKDVLILEQFMRVDGTVLPKQLTGLCTKQQLRIERCVMQAHWSGLFPDRTHPDLDLAGYKRFKRYWNDDKELYSRQLKQLPGTWYYVKRYVTKKGEFAERLPSFRKDKS